MENEPKLEEEILASFERDEWRPVHDAGKAIKRYSAYAEAALVKDKRVNIRISARDLEDIQTRAAAEGVPYQTLMSSVLHKFVTGRLIEVGSPRPPAAAAPTKGRRRAG